MNREKLLNERKRKRRFSVMTPRDLIKTAVNDDDRKLSVTRLILLMKFQNISQLKLREKECEKDLKNSSRVE